jgi:hypothetical protein
MKIYCSEINLAEPNNIQIWVSKNSDYGIGISVIKDGKKIDAKLFDGDTEIQSSNSLDKYTVFNMKSANKTESKKLTVKAGNQEIKLFVNTTDSDCAEVTPPMPEMPESGLNEEGVKELLTSGNLESMSVEEITTGTVNANTVNVSDTLDTNYVNVHYTVTTEETSTGNLTAWNDVTVGNIVEASMFHGSQFAPKYSETQDIVNSAPYIVYEKWYDENNDAHMEGYFGGDWKADRLTLDFGVHAFDVTIKNELRFTDYETGEDIILTVNDIKQLLQLINTGA